MTNIHKEAASRRLAEATALLEDDPTDEDRERSRQLTEEAFALIYEAYGFENA